MSLLIGIFFLGVFVGAITTIYVVILVSIFEEKNSTESQIDRASNPTAHYIGKEPRNHE